MERTAADAMSDDNDLTPQEPEAQPLPTEVPAEANPVMELALKDLQQRRDALEAEINELSKRKQQLESELTASFAGQSDAIARRVAAIRKKYAVKQSAASSTLDGGGRRRRGGGRHRC